MKKYSRKYYQAHFPNYGGRIDYQSGNVRDMRREIDEQNAKAIEKGYKAEQFIITFVEWCRIFDDNGIFQEEVKKEKFVEIYPETLAEQED